MASKKTGPTGRTRPPSVAIKKSSNRTAIILGSAVVLVVVAMIVVAMVVSDKQKAPQADGYGTGSSTATFADGKVTIGGGAPITLEVFEDAICPHCGEFERKYGQQIAQAVDEKKINVVYRPLAFLDAASSSGDYSTRVVAALICTAQNSGGTPGVYQALHSRLFAADVQPGEHSGADHNNAFLADLARRTGAGEAAAACITGGASMTAATTATDASAQTLQQTIGTVGSPVVLMGGTLVDTTPTGWLTNILT